MKKPKVLFILHLPPPMHGAAIAGQYIKQSILINEEFEADYINLATNKILSESGKGSFKKIFTFSRLLTQIITALSKKKYDLCYITLTSSGAGFYKDFIVVSVVKLFTKKIIYHFHNKGISDKENKIPASLYRYVFKNTKSILLSPYLYYDIQKYVSEKDIFYCPCGIPVNKLTDRSVERAAKKQQFYNPTQLLFLSNMMREKGIFVLLDACEQLKKNELSFECHFVGGWSEISEEAFNNKIKDKNLSEVVFAHGPKYNEEKAIFFSKADIFVFPTFYHYEAFPLVNIEAMQNGLTVVSTPEGGIPEEVIDGKTGYLVSQEDAAALAEKLTLLIQKPELRIEMGLAGKQRFEEFFYVRKI